MADDRFERLKQIAKDEFGVSIVKTDNSKTSQMLLDELKAELKVLENNYPNLMCFGNEQHKCNCQKSCQNYKECEESYYENHFSFMEADHRKQ